MSETSRRSRLGEGGIVLLAAIIGAMSSLGGVLLNEHLTAKRDLQAQFREDKKGAYFEFLSTGLSLTEAPAAPREELEKRRQEGQEKMEKVLGLISLVASRNVFEQAASANSHCRLLLDSPVTRGECIAALEEFRKKARQELNPELK